RGPLGRRTASRRGAWSGCRARSWSYRRLSCVPCAVLLALDRSDAHLGELLPVPDVAPVVGLGLELVDVDLVAAAVADDLGLHRRALDVGSADLDGVVTAEQKDGELDLGAGLGLELL